MRAEVREHAAQAHVPVRTYVGVGIFLAVVTAIEVAIPYLLGRGGTVVALLLALGALKFGTVAAYFMHLKFDRRVLTWVFAVGLALGLVVTVGLIIGMAA